MYQLDNLILLILSFKNSNDKCTMLAMELKWQLLLFATCLIELKNIKSEHSIYIQYFYKDKVDQNNKTCILNAGCTNLNENKVILSKLVKWVNNKRGYTRTKAFKTLIFFVRNKEELFRVLLFQIPSLMEYEYITPFDLATLIIDTIPL
ncbi:hypothetical protein ACTFIW_012058 [Dictyostelium discoideum]